MTSSRYLLAKFAQSFGIHRRNFRLGEAASEAHLLRDAETHLGAAIWEKVEEVEELSIEYWNLRKLAKQKEEVETQLKRCESRLETAHEARSLVLTSLPQDHEALTEKRTQLLEKIDQLSQKREQIIEEAREVRRLYEGVKMKLEVIEKEQPDSDALRQVQSRLLELKEKFSALKGQRSQVGEEIDSADKALDQLESDLSEQKDLRRADASEAFQVIGDGNKEFSKLRAEKSVIENQMRQLYTEIGRFVSHHTHHHATCAKAVSNQRGMVEIMTALRKSILLNQRLAGTN